MNVQTPTVPRAWVQTFTGVQFWPFAPRVEDIFIVDIAHALSNICRYNGHTTIFYSVAEHSVHMARHASPRNALAALLHDASEAYLGDVPAPLKCRGEFDGYRRAESRLEQVIAARFGLRHPFDPEIHDLDRRILADERAQLLVPPPDDWGLGELCPLGVELQCWTPNEARTQFLTEFNRLSPEGAP